MSARFRNVDRSTPLLLPVDMRSWVPEDDLVHFVLAAVETVSLPCFRVNHRGTGSAQYPPRMMLALLIYCYANGLFGSRRIERATYRDIAIRYLTGDLHPDHDTICKFRRENFAAVSEAFLQVLKLAGEMELLRVGTISVDGTKLKANASKFRSVRYDRICELERQLELDIAELMRQAEQADCCDAEDGQSLPDELAHREKLRERMGEARRKLEQRAAARAEAEREDYERKLRERDKRPPNRCGAKPKPPRAEPRPEEQINLTDEDSGIMRRSKRSEYQQAYNAQAAVDADGSQLVLHSHVSTNASDAGELESSVDGVTEKAGKPSAVLADSGYVDAEVFDRLQQGGTEPYVPPSREAASKSRKYEFRPHQAMAPKKLKDPRLIHMREKLQTDTGRALYARRKQTVEPVFGIIKHAMGFRQFLLRGTAKVTGEWELVCLGYNVKRLFNLANA